MALSGPTRQVGRFPLHLLKARAILSDCDGKCGERKGGAGISDS